MGLFDFFKKKQKDDQRDDPTFVKSNSPSETTEVPTKPAGKIVLSRVVFPDGYVSPSGGYSNNALFEIQGKNPKTGRVNKRKVGARTKCEAIERAEKQYGFTEISAKCIPFDPPTEAQLELSKRLRLYIPDGATKEDVSCMIGRMVENTLDVDDPEFAPIESCPQEWANYFCDDGLTFSAYISIESAFELAEQCLSPRKRCKFYAYCVWCHFNKEPIIAPFNHPMEFLFDSFADEYYENEQFMGLLSKTSFAYIHGNEKTVKIAKEFMKNRGYLS